MGVVSPTKPKDNPNLKFEGIQNLSDDEIVGDSDFRILPENIKKVFGRVRECGLHFRNTYCTASSHKNHILLRKSPMFCSHTHLCHLCATREHQKAMNHRLEALTEVHGEYGTSLITCYVPTSEPADLTQDIEAGLTLLSLIGRLRRGSRAGYGGLGYDNGQLIVWVILGTEDADGLVDELDKIKVNYEYSFAKSSVKDSVKRVTDLLIGITEIAKDYGDAIEILNALYKRRVIRSYGGIRATVQPGDNHKSENHFGQCPCCKEKTDPLNIINTVYLCNGKEIRIKSHEAVQGLKSEEIQFRISEVRSNPPPD